MPKTRFGSHAFRSETRREIWRSSKVEKNSRKYFIIIHGVAKQG